jgi:prepilin-type N-terminal cleavage/methylation domain-containing protein
MNSESQERKAESQRAGSSATLACDALRHGRGRGRHGSPSKSLPASRFSLLAPRSGLTLIELLVVVVILTMLVAAAIPILSPSNDDRRIREASRGVNEFISGAQTKAVQLRRPYGVALKKLSQDTGSEDDRGVCVELFYVEQPPAYLGFSDTSAARVSFYNPGSTSLYPNVRPLVLIEFVARGNAVDMSNDGLPAGWDADQFPGGMIRPGDVIEFNGNRYELLSDTSDNGIVPRFTDSTNTFFDFDTGKAGDDSDKPSQIVARPLNDSGQMINVKYDEFGNDLVNGKLPSDTSKATYWTSPAPYKIFRQPMPTSDEPYQLPEGTAIDLRASGDEDGAFHDVEATKPEDAINNDAPVVIMFAPEGTVQRVRFNRYPGNSIPFNEPVTSTIFLLVGRREIIPPPTVALDKTLAMSTLPASSEPNRDQAMRQLKDPLNWLRGESRWIAIGSQSGRVVTVENAFVDPAAVINKYLNPPNVTEKSEEMRNGQIVEAREFARQMTQMGGG